MAVPYWPALQFPTAARAAAAPEASYTPAPIAVWILAEVAAVIAVELENAAMFGLTGEPLVVTIPPGHPVPSARQWASGTPLPFKSVLPAPADETPVLLT